MELLFTRQFEKDIKKVKDKKLAKSIEATILNVKSATDMSQIDNLKKLKGSQHAYRIRIGDYRIGLYLNGSTLEFSCFMNRNEVYRYFP